MNTCELADSVIAAAASGEKQPLSTRMCAVDTATATALIRHLAFDPRNLHIQAEAVRSLCRQSGPDTEICLRQLANDSTWHFHVREIAMTGLARLNLATASEFAEIVLDSQDGNTRLSALKALGLTDFASTIQSPVTIQSLRRVFELSADSFVRKYSGLYLAYRGQGDARELLLSEFANGLWDDAVPKLESLAAACALANIGVEPARIRVRELLMHIECLDEHQRWEVCSILRCLTIFKDIHDETALIGYAAQWCA